ncbi:hypothetical protein MAR_033401 [Mya arenaria]|uniref:Uncharacterized protein n=1 Tax=Mya arenaria TaxID=6604 RepID=A0ABY7GBK3_MYAAR|nr:hypothetical protein MAR_033401 [Mya arenaria]
MDPKPFKILGVIWCYLMFPPNLVHGSDTYNTGYLQVTVSSTLTTADACTEPVSTAKYYTLVNTASIASSKDTCATILLASFSYACASNATKTSQMSVCSTTNYQTGIEVDDTNCNDTSILDTGSYYCVAETSESASDGLTYYYQMRDPNAGKPIVENTKPRFEDPDKEDELIDMEVDTARSTPLTRDEITFDAVSPSIISNGKIGNGHAKSLSPDGLFSTHNTSSMQDSGIALTDKSIGERPTPRIGINPSKESMVIFNGDQKVISGNDTRIVPNTNPNPRVFHMENFIRGEGPLTIEGLDEEDDSVGELTSRENYPYPSLPREKSNLMPPIETSDPEKNKDKS